MDKRILLPLVILPAFQTGNMQAADQPAKRPNIIFFMVDDMGWEDTSLPFWTEKTHYNEVYETPNMERLARQGVMFTQAYASSISSPSRCSLITGTNAARHRVTNWTLQKDKTTDRKDSLLDIPDWNYNGVSQVPGTNNTFVGTSFVQLLKIAVIIRSTAGKPISARSTLRERTRTTGDSKSTLPVMPPAVWQAI